MCCKIVLYNSKITKNYSNDKIYYNNTVKKKVKKAKT